MTWIRDGRRGRLRSHYRHLIKPEFKIRSHTQLKNLKLIT